VTRRRLALTLLIAVLVAAAARLAAGWGTIRFHSPARWDVYREKRLAAYTRGPQGVAAGFLWLQTTRPLHSRSTLDSRRAISG
jgi:hypothetical protein